MLIDKSQFLEVWWNEVSSHDASLLLAPSGFGKTQLLWMIRDFFSNECNSTSITNQIISQNIPFVQAHKAKYDVLMIDLGRMIGTSWEAAHDNFGIKCKSGAECLTQIMLGHEDGILLIDNIDTPLLSGFLFDYYEEVVEFIASFIISLESYHKFKIQVTATTDLFLQELRSEFPQNTSYHNIYSDKLGAFIGFKLGAVQWMLNQLPNDVKSRCLSLDHVIHKFGGYRIDLDPQPTIHPIGVLEMVKATSINSVFSGNTFSPTIPLLIQIYAKMNLSYWSLLSIIHNNKELEVKKPCMEDDSYYSFFDFVAVLHDFGLMVKKLPRGDMFISNADARLAIMAICNYFMGR